MHPWKVKLLQPATPEKMEVFAINDFWLVVEPTHLKKYDRQIGKSYPTRGSLGQWTLKKKVWTLFSLLNIRHPQKFKKLAIG